MEYNISTIRSFVTRFAARDVPVVSDVANLWDDMLMDATHDQASFYRWGVSVAEGFNLDLDDVFTLANLIGE